MPTANFAYVNEFFTDLWSKIKKVFPVSKLRLFHCLGIECRRTVRFALRPS